MQRGNISKFDLLTKASLEIITSDFDEAIKNQGVELEYSTRSSSGASPVFFGNIYGIFLTTDVEPEEENVRVDIKHTILCSTKMFLDAGVIPSAEDSVEYNNEVYMIRNPIRYLVHNNQNSLYQDSLFVEFVLFKKTDFQRSGTFR